MLDHLLLNFGARFDVVGRLMDHIAALRHDLYGFVIVRFDEFPERFVPRVERLYRNLEAEIENNYGSNAYAKIWKLCN